MIAPTNGGASRVAASELAPGHELAGKYVIESALGEGATSFVYVARRKEQPGARRASPAARETLDEDTDPGAAAPDLVALKVIRRSLSEDPQIVGRFRREAEILKRLEGPHVLHVHEVFEDDGLLVMVLEYVPSTPLDQRLAEGAPLDVATAVEITLQVCAGLGTAHAAGVVHRDLKPANVLFASDGEGDRGLVRVADFGLAKLVHGDKMITGLTEHDMIFGTPEYMAPEQARGEEVDARADLYAAGIMLYEMLTGEVPFHGRSPMVTMSAHLMQQPTPPRQKRTDGAISPALEAVVMRALAKSPADRYPSARAFAEALLAASTGKQVISIASPADALSDTDLNVAISTTLTHSPTIPSEPPRSGPRADTRAPVDAIEPTSSAPLTDAEPDSILPPTVRAGPRWLWYAVALFAALVAIAIGIVMGTR